MAYGKNCVRLIFRTLLMLFSFLLPLSSLASCASQPGSVETHTESAVMEETEEAGKPESETVEPDTETSEKEDPASMKITLDNYNYVLGTQAFAPNYQFTDRSPLSEISERITDMGSNMVKFYATDDNMIDDLIRERPEIKHIFAWYRSDPVFQDGYSPLEAKNDYNAFYKLTKHLLETYSGTGITFYLGHWEGDWYYLKRTDTSQKTIDDTVTNGMIKWINNRQKAVDDAKAAVSYSDVNVWNYLELNRPTDAFDHGFDRVVNKVLPNTNVDLVSYSAYDCMYDSGERIQKIIEYIYSYLPEKASVEGPRVFIGEFGQPAANCGFNDLEHARQNLIMFKKYLSCNVRFILYWQMYDNEKLEDGSCRGFWLVNDKDEQTALYRALEDLLDKGRDYVRDYYRTNGTYPSLDEYKTYLLSLPIFP